ncbi:DUF4124 domain-containing protein [Pseudomonas sp. zbq_18]|uniref:DUF4124 domain-containing protein n=1 Tax=Pseudomonas sp. zbq_18 TaxID=3367251 RepID=UPI00370BA3CD
MRRMILACSVLLALSTTVSAGQIYKWVDAQGNVHFGSQPPEGQKAAEVNPNISQPKPPAPQVTATPADSEDAVQEKLDQQAREDVAKNEAERKVYCERIRKDLAQMKANPRVRIEDGGELRRLTEEERQERISKSEASIKENCQ